MTNDPTRAEDPLTRRAEEIERLKRTVDDTTFADDQKDASGELSMVDQHPADVSDFTYQREMQETVREMLDKEAGQIQDAIRRKEAGTYGICENCGKPINPERLKALPEATLCIDCQRHHEERHNSA